jgi:hypothetical protein
LGGRLLGSPEETTAAPLVLLTTSSVVGVLGDVERGRFLEKSSILLNKVSF